MNDAVTGSTRKSTPSTTRRPLVAALVQQAFGQDPFCGAVYLFRGKRGRLIKCIWHDGQGHQKAA